MLDIFSHKGGFNFSQRHKEEKGAEVEAVSLRLFKNKEFITGNIFIATLREISRPLAGKYTLGKIERLKSRKKIEALFSSGQRYTSGPFVVYYRLHNDSVQSQVQAGFSASKKNFRKAVDRNRAKRILRELYRLQNAALKYKVKTGHKSLDIFIIYTGKELPVYTEVSVKFEPLLQKLMAIYDKA